MPATNEKPCLLSDGVPPDALRSVATRAGLPALGGDESREMRDRFIILLMASMNVDRLQPALARPYRGYVEFAENDLDTIGLRVRSAAVAHFSLAMTTSSAFGVDLAKLACDALEMRGILTRDRRLPVELALHEVIANAILHGNLGLESSQKETPEQFESFCDRIRQRLDDPSARARWIEVKASWSDTDLEVIVTDEGDGFVPETLPESDIADLEKPFGRGLSIVRTLATEVQISEGGRRKSLRFSNDPADN